MSSSAEPRAPRELARCLGLVTLCLLHAGLAALLSFLAWADRQQPAPGIPPENALAIPPVLIGRVARLDTQAFVASTYTDERPVRIDPLTVVLRREGPAAFSELRPGRGVIVWGRVGTDGSVLAEKILVAGVP